MSDTSSPILDPYGNALISNRIAAANEALLDIAPRESRAEISIVPRKGVHVSWSKPWADSQRVTKRWTCNSGGWPPWSRQWPTGGTGVQALFQLVRWVQERPILPIRTWRYWASDTVKMLPPEAVDKLLAAGWPESVLCVLCKGTIDPPITGLDWWHLDGVSGPCCGPGKGCQKRGDDEFKQRGPSTAADSPSTDP